MTLIDGPAGPIEVKEKGQGPPVVLIPSLGRSAGDKDVLVVQPEDDVMAVPENAVRLCDELGDRASLVTVPDAGHALLPEQPDAVAGAVLEWLRQRNRISNIQG